jgi:hypothetical protein
MSTSASTGSGGRSGKTIVTISTLVLLLVVFALKESGSVTVFGLSVPVGAVVVVGYLLGLAAGWGATRRS